MGTAWPSGGTRGWISYWFDRAGPPAAFQAAPSPRRPLRFRLIPPKVVTAEVFTWPELALERLVEHGRQQGVEFGGGLGLEALQAGVARPTPTLLPRVSRSACS
jgi:hypothetical protein